MIGKSINFLHQVCHDQTPTTKMIAVTKSADSPQDGMMIVIMMMTVVVVVVWSIFHSTGLTHFLNYSKISEYTVICVKDSLLHKFQILIFIQS